MIETTTLEKVNSNYLVMIVLEYKVSKKYIYKMWLTVFWSIIQELYCPWSLLQKYKLQYAFIIYIFFLSKRTKDDVLRRPLKTLDINYEEQLANSTTEEVCSHI